MEFNNQTMDRMDSKDHSKYHSRESMGLKEQPGRRMKLKDQPRSLIEPMDQPFGRMKLKDQPMSFIEPMDQPCGRMELKDQPFAPISNSVNTLPLCHKKYKLHKKSYIDDLTMLDKITLSKLMEKQE